MGVPAVVQSAPEDAKYLFDPNNRPQPTYLSDKFIPFTTTVLGFLLPTLTNWQKRRPMFSGLPIVVGSTLLGLAGGVWWEQKNQAYFAERDAIYRHYIELHPEDFVPKERKLVGELMKPWAPVR